MDEDPVEALYTDLRKRRRRAIAIVLGLVAIAALVALLALILRERKVYLIGGSEEVTASVEGVARFRLETPHAAVVQVGPGSHPVTARRGPAIDWLHVPWAPWVTQVVAPTEAGQCLIVASGRGMYGPTGRPDALHVQAFTREPRSIALPALFSDVVATHPCRLPPSIRLIDTIVMVATVPCAEAPASDEEARERVLAQLAACQLGAAGGA